MGGPWGRVFNTDAVHCFLPLYPKVIIFGTLLDTFRGIRPMPHNSLHDPSPIDHSSSQCPSPACQLQPIRWPGAARPCKPTGCGEALPPFAAPDHSGHPRHAVGPARGRGRGLEDVLFASAQRDAVSERNWYGSCGTSIDSWELVDGATLSRQMSRSSSFAGLTWPFLAILSFFALLPAKHGEALGEDFTSKVDGSFLVTFMGTWSACAGAVL